MSSNTQQIKTIKNIIVDRRNWRDEVFRGVDPASSATRIKGLDPSYAQVQYRNAQQCEPDLAPDNARTARPGYWLALRIALG
jgi:hypothetical protein